MTDPTLFDVLVRTDDPATSKAAAGTVNRNRREAEVIGALRDLTYATAHDIGIHVGRDTNCVARRLTSLERAGTVRRCGVKPGPYGRDCTLWRLV